MKWSWPWSPAKPEPLPEEALQQPAQTTIAPALRFCVECRYCRPAFKGDKFPYCESPHNGVDIVTGKGVRRLAFIVMDRGILCGKTGEWFEPKS